MVNTKVFWSLGNACYSIIMVTHLDKLWNRLDTSKTNTGIFPQNKN